MNTAVLILAGGSGIRLWPLSRKSEPKQFLPVLNNGLSFFSATVSRALKITDASRIFILTQKSYSAFIASQAPQISEENIFFEPHKKNTAPAIATALMKITKRLGDTVSVVLPADHYIADEPAFLSAVSLAYETAKSDNKIITIGITPTRPDTSFGYIKYTEETSNGVFRTEGFKEKPDYDKAIELISGGKCLWNSGIFVCRTSFMLGQYKKYLPEVFNCAERICGSSDSDEADEIYLSMPEISVDYGILEKTDDVLIIKGCFGWDDIGSWTALDRLFSDDDNGNIIKGDALTLNAKNCTVIGSSGLTVAAGTEDLFIINTPDVTLVFPKNSVGLISDLPAIIKENGLENLL